MNSADALNVSADWLSVTVPWDQSGGLSADILDAMAPLRLLEAPGGDGRWLTPSGGSVRVQRLGSVFSVSVSGRALADVREAGAFDALLWVLADRPYRVTRLDAARDVATHAPPVLAALYERGKARGLRLTQRPAPVSWTKSASLTGEDTGTVYVGRRTSEVFARVYDKRQEMLDKGEPDPGPLLRYEVVVKGTMGVTLQDVARPALVYWNFAAPALHPFPVGVYVGGWRPWAVGFDLPKPAPREGTDRLQRSVEGSGTLAAWIEAADALGPHGRAYLRSLLLQRLDRAPASDHRERGTGAA